MILPTVIDEIRRLLREDRLSQREIARQIGVSRGTVSAIARGRRPNGRDRRPTVDDGFVTPTGLPERCPGCGGRVQMPCLLCYIRAKNQRRRGKRDAPSSQRNRTAPTGC